MTDKPQTPDLTITLNAGKLQRRVHYRYWGIKEMLKIRMACALVFGIFATTAQSTTLDFNFSFTNSQNETVSGVFFGLKEGVSEAALVTVQSSYGDRISYYGDGRDVFSDRVFIIENHFVIENSQLKDFSFSASSGQDFSIFSNFNVSSEPGTQSFFSYTVTSLGYDRRIRGTNPPAFASTLAVPLPSSVWFLASTLGLGLAIGRKKPLLHKSLMRE